MPSQSSMKLFLHPLRTLSRFPSSAYPRIRDDGTVLAVPELRWTRSYRASYLSCCIYRGENEARHRDARGEGRGQKDEEGTGDSVGRSPADDCLPSIRITKTPRNVRERKFIGAPGWIQCCCRIMIRGLRYWILDVKWFSFNRVCNALSLKHMCQIYRNQFISRDLHSCKEFYSDA